MFLSDCKKKVESRVKRMWGVGLKRSKKKCRNDSAFHNGDSCFMYDWINNEHGDSSPEGLKETEWLTNQLYWDASKEPIK
jgi:hypothetical protein